MGNILKSLFGSDKSTVRSKGNERAIGTMLRAQKGRVIPPPVLDEPLKTVADAITQWPAVTASTHWDPSHPARVDGIDLYFGEEELGHIHLDGRIHLATCPRLGKVLVERGLARPLIYIRGWVEEKVQDIGAKAAVELFRVNYDWLSDTSLSK
jgi:Family of unknown function (DUF5519)